MPRIAPPQRLFYRDLVLGPVILNSEEASLLHTAEMTRLSEIKQLALAHLFYPHATHTRLEHSAGAAWRARLFVEALPTGELLKLEMQDRRAIMAAALLHDVGHSAWSHLGERFSRYLDKPINHNKRSAAIILDDEHQYDHFFQSWGQKRIYDVLDKTTREKVAALVQGDPPFSQTEFNALANEEEKQRYIQEAYASKSWMGQLVNSQLDVDRADYLTRDAFFTVTTTHLLVDPVTAAAKIGIVYSNAEGEGEALASRKELAFLDLSFAESFLVTRELMYAAVYLEDRNLVAEELLIRAFLRGLRGLDIDEFWFSTDAEIWRRLQGSDNPFVQEALQLLGHQELDKETFHIITTIPFSSLADQALENVRFLDRQRSVLPRFEADIALRSGVKEHEVLAVIVAWQVSLDLGKVLVQHSGQPPQQVMQASLLLKTLLGADYTRQRSRVLIAVHPAMEAGARESVVTAVRQLLEENLKHKYKPQ